MNYSRKCVKCGLCLREHEWELLDGMCPKCYNKYFEMAISNGCKNSAEILREYYRNKFDEIIKKG